MIRIPFLRKNRERGLGLLEVALALIVIAALGAGISQMISDNSKTLQAKNDAEKIKTVAKAAQQYLNSNQAALLAATGAGATVAIPVAKTTAAGASPAAPAGFNSLQDAGFLPSSFIDQNSSQQAHALLVRQNGGDLEAIITSYGGVALDDAEVGSISGLLGAAGGGVYNTAAIAATTDITGTRGGWGEATASWNASIGGTPVQPSSGTVQVNMDLANLVGFQDTTNETKFLHREASADPSLNQMETDIDMNTFNINNVGEVQTSDYDEASNSGEGYEASPVGRIRIQRPSTAAAANAVLDGYYGNARTFRLTADGSATGGGDLSFSGNSTLGDAATDTHTISGNVTMNHDASVGGDLSASGDATVTGDLSTDGSATLGNAPGDSHTINGSVNVTGGTTVAGTTNLNGNTNIGNSSTDVHTVRGNLTSNNRIIASRFEDTQDPSYWINMNQTSVLNNLTVNGTFTAGDLNATNVTATNNVTAGNQLRGPRFVDTNGNIVVDPSGTSNFTDLALTGDITSVDGIESATGTKWENAGNIRSTSGNIRALAGVVRGANVTSDGTLTVSSGGANISGTAAITGSASTTGNLTVQGNSNIGDQSSDSHTFRGSVTVRNGADLTARRMVDGNDSSYFIDPNGTSTLFAANIQLLQFSSDRRLKKDIEDISGLEILAKLQPKSYRWKNNNKYSYGLIAQDVEEHFPHLVGTLENGQKSVQYIELIAPLIDAVQELQAEVDQLKN